MSWGFLGLFAGSLLLQLERHALAPWGLVEPRGVFYQTVQGTRLRRADAPGAGDA